MRPIPALLAAALCLALHPAIAASSLQEKMQTCNEGAARKELAGEARKLYMKGCLGGRKGRTTEQQQRMKTCNADAGARHMKGDARRNFLKQCLGSGPATAQSPADTECTRAEVICSATSHRRAPRSHLPGSWPSPGQPKRPVM